MTQAERRAFWRERVAAYRGSGLSVAAWCRENDVKEHQMRRWIERIDAESGRRGATDNPTGWLSVPVEGDAPREEGGGITLQIGQVKIDVRPGFDRGLLADVLRVLNATC